MFLVRTPQGEIKEVESLSEGTELSSQEIAELLAQEAANVELLGRRIAEYPNMIAQEEAKKEIFTDEGDIRAADDRIALYGREQENEVASKARAKSMVILYTQYI